MKTTYAILLAVFALLFGFAVGQKRMSNAAMVEAVEKPVTIRWIVWTDANGKIRQGNVILAKSRGHEYRGDHDGSANDIVQIHGEIDAQPFMIYAKFEGDEHGDSGLRSP